MATAKVDPTNPGSSSLRLGFGTKESGNYIPPKPDTSKGGVSVKTSTGGIQYGADGKVEAIYDSTVGGSSSSSSTQPPQQQTSQSLTSKQNLPKSIQPPKENIIKSIALSPIRFASGSYEWQKKLTPQLKEQERQNQMAIESERTQSYKSLLEAGNIPGIARKGTYDLSGRYLQGVEFVKSKVGLGKLSPSGFKTTQGIISDTALTSGFGIVLPTRVGIAKSIKDTSTVSFVGSNQRLTGKAMKTDIVFTTSKGSMGKATGFSVQNKPSTKLTDTLTIATGKASTGRSYKMNLNPKIEHNVERFGGGDIARTFKVGKFSFTKSIGASIPAKFTKIGYIKMLKKPKMKDATSYFGLGMGKTQGKRTLQVDFLGTPKGNIRVVGLTRQKPRLVEPKPFADYVQRFVKNTKGQLSLAPPRLENPRTITLRFPSKPKVVKDTAFADNSLLATQRIVASQFSVPQRLPTGVTRSSLSSISSSRFYQPTKTNIFYKPAVKVDTLTKQNTLQIQRTNQKSSQIVQQTPRQRQQQRTTVIPKILLKPTVPSRTVINPPIRTPRRAIVPYFNFNLPSSRRTVRKSPFKLRGFGVSRAPSLLALGTNIRSTSFGKVESSGLTVRPILTRRKKRRK